MFIRANVLCVEGAPDEASAVGAEILQAAEANESPAACIQREIREELGLNLQA
jgi:hypothetical protein